MPDSTPKEQRDRLEAIQFSLRNALRPISVLVVEDDADDAALLKLTLGKMGVGVMMAVNGEEAVREIKRTRYHVALLDWKLTGKSGLATLKEMKAADPECVVIVITAYFTDDNAVQALGEGAAAIMPKPITTEQLKLIFDSP